jgi:hypothetical protein
MERHAWIYGWLRSKNAIKRKEMREHVQRACKVAILGSVEATQITLSGKWAWRTSLAFPALVLATPQHRRCPYSC